MSVRYTVPVADSILATREYWEPVEGFRLISVDGPWLAHPYVTLCTFEDDNAPEDMAGKLVEPVLSSDYADGRMSRVWISDRVVVGDGGAR